MMDMLYCPICCCHLKSNKPRYKQLNGFGKSAYYIYRYCYDKPHQLSFFVDKSTCKVDWMRLVVSDCSISVEIDFTNNKSVVRLLENKKETAKMNFDDVLPLDFPKLEKLKEKIELLMVFS